MPPEYGPAVPPPGGVHQARQRVQAPAIALIVVGVLNLFLAAVPALQALQLTRIPPEEFAKEFDKAVEKQNPQTQEDMKKLGWTPEMIHRWAIAIPAASAIADFLASFLVILGGVRMLSLKSYSLAIFASLLAAVPCISCMGCCGLGQIAGLWALIVLVSADVQTAFRGVR
jgi:hypothetical protein